MPIYEYRCQACGHKLEAIQKVSDASLTDCPECREAALGKLVSAAGFRLKGGGWYETDFKSDKKRNLAVDSEEKSEKKVDGDGAKKKGDEKPASKTDSKASAKPEKKDSGSGTTAPAS